MRPLPVFLVVAVCASMLFSSGTQAADSPTKAYVVFGITVADAEAHGVDVKHDYDVFFTAMLTDEDSAWLRNSGGAVEELRFGSGRGGVQFGSPIDEDLRAESTSHFVVQFDGPIKAAWWRELQSVATIFDSMPNYAVLIESRVSPQAISELPGVREVHTYHPAHKMAMDLPSVGVATLAISLYPDSSDARLRAEIARLGGHVLSTYDSGFERYLFTSIDSMHIRAIARLDEVMWIEPHHARATPDIDRASNVTQGAGLNTSKFHDLGITGAGQFVLNCDVGFPARTVLANTSRTVYRPFHETFNNTSLSDWNSSVEWNSYLSSTPLTVTHPKIAGYFSPRDNATGTLYGDGAEPPPGTQNSPNHQIAIAGILAGDKDLNGIRDVYDGIAFGSKLFLCDASNGTSYAGDPPDPWATVWPAYVTGARIGSYSYGTNYTPFYTGISRRWDEMIWNHRDMLIFHSEGNIHAGANEDTTQAVNVTFTRPEANAKNGLAIGGSENKPTLNGPGLPPSSTGDPEQTCALCNHGPTADGRIKPDIIAPADCVTGPTGYIPPVSNRYACGSGTSEATPVAAGAAALIRQYLADGYYPSGTSGGTSIVNESAALMRALLMVGAYEISGDGDPSFPNSIQGWGRVHLDNVLYTSGTPADFRKLRFVDEGATLTTGQSWSTTVSVGDGAVPFRVMLAWTDYPAAVGTNETDQLVGPALVNDLDLKVTRSLLTYVGNNFVGNETAVSSTALSDRKNVEEGVFICGWVGSHCTAAGPATYTITVTAYQTRSEGQNFALAITGDI